MERGAGQRPALRRGRRRYPIGMFDPEAYGPVVAGILALDRGSAEARDTIRRSGLPDLVRAGLFLHLGCWKEAHEVAQDIDTQDGSYWHAIVHRLEPDASNAAYWFRRVGSHPTFPALRARAAESRLPHWCDVGSDRIHRLLREGAAWL